MNEMQIVSNPWYSHLLKLVRQDYITPNPFSRPGLPIREHRFTVWHYTANPGASAENHRRYFESLRLQRTDDHAPDRYASAHIFIDKDSACLIIPLWEQAYHAGDPWHNARSVSCELCVEANGHFHSATIERAIKVGALLQLMFGYPTGHNLRHYDITGKLCPKPWVDRPELFQQFKREMEKQIQAYLAAATTPVEVNIHYNHHPIPVKGFLQQGVSYIPVRPFAEAIGLGQLVDWDANARRILLAGTQLSTTRLVDGTGYASSREVAACLQLQVEWEQSSKTVHFIKEQT